MKSRFTTTSIARWFLLNGIIAVVYLVTAKLSLMLAFEQTSSSPVWPPAGFGLAAVLLLGCRVWPGILLGVFIANVTVFVGNQAEATTITIALTSLCIAVGSTLEPLAGAFLFRRLIGLKNTMDRGQDAFAFAAVGALSCLASSIIGPTSICVAALAPWDIFGMMSLTWWLGDLSGVLIVTPIIIGWRRQQLVPISIPKVVEAAILLVMLFLVGLFIFSGWTKVDLVHSLTYLVIPFLLWIAFRFGQQVSAGAVALIAGMTIWATIHGEGPFITESLNTSLILVQGFACVIAMTVLVLTTSVSEKREANETLYEREKKYRSLFDDALDMIHIVNEKGQIIDANKIEIETLGYTREEYIGKPLFEIIHPDYRAITKLNLEKIFQGIEVRGHETVFINKHGEKIDVEVNSVPQEVGGKIVRGRAIIRDITERKQVDKALKKSEKQAHSLLQNIQAAVVVHGPDTNIIKCNTASQELLGLTEDQILGKKAIDPSWKFFNEDGSDMQIELYPVNRVTASKKVIKDVIMGVFRPNKNDVVRVLVNAIPEFYADGNISQVIVTFMDITERKLAEERSNKMNRLNEDLLVSDNLEDNLKLITDSIIGIFNADFARIWITNTGDLCNSGCIHTQALESPHACEKRDLCLHLVSSSGRYTHINGRHSRVPYGCYKIGRIASGEDSKFITNDVVHDPGIHDKEWAINVGLVSFAGYRLLSEAGRPIGVLALFSKYTISSDTSAQLEGLANTTSQVIQTALKGEVLLQERNKLQNAVAKIRTLSGMLPICSTCKKIRDDKGYWNQIELFIRDHSEAEFSHSLCPDCLKKHYPDMDMSED